MARPKEFDLDAAIDDAIGLFRRQGFARTTPQQLADELGIGKGSLYNTFGSKRALFELALDRYLDRRIELTNELTRVEAPVKDVLRAALLDLIAQRFADPSRNACLVTSSAVEIGCDDEAVAKATRDLYRHTEAAFTDLLRRAQRDGEIGSDADVSATASLLLNTVVGMEVLSMVDREPDRLRRIVDATLALL